MYRFVTIAYLNKNMWVANNNKKSFGSSDGHIKAFWIGQKAQSTLQIIAWYSLIRAHLEVEHNNRLPIHVTLVIHYSVHLKPRE